MDIYTSTFKTCYSKCCRKLSKSPIAHNYKFELYPFLYHIMGIALSADLSSYINVTGYLLKYIFSKLQASETEKFFSRLELYSDVIGGNITPRCECMMNTDFSSTNPVLYDFIVFGDILVNPNCANDYKNAPISLPSVFEVYRFSKILMEEVTPIILNCFDPSAFRDKNNSHVSDDNSSPKTNSAGNDIIKEPNKSKKPFQFPVTILIIAAVVLPIFIASFLSHATAPAETPLPTIVPTVRPTPVFTAEPLSLPYNGQEFLSPGYTRVCPLTITASTDSSYYIYLQYRREPTESYDSRHVSGYGEGEDLSFFIRAGETVELDVPVGVYRLYYATGDTWYGTEHKFGPRTAYFTSDDLLHFYTTYNTIYGNTLELWAQYNGNFETEIITASSFPD